MEIKTKKMTLEEAEALGIEGWPAWTCKPSAFDWHYDDKETAYVFEGRVMVTPRGGESVEITGGMLVEFPKGMTCRWEVIEAISKVYKFG